MADLTVSRTFNPHLQGQRDSGSGANLLAPPSVELAPARREGEPDHGDLELGERVVQQIHPPVVGVIPRGETKGGGMHLGMARNHCAGLVGAGIGALGYSLVEPDGIPDIVYLGAALGGAAAGYALTYASYRVRDALAHRREAKAMQGSTPATQLARVVELANVKALIPDGLRRTVGSIIALRRTHPHEVSAAAAANAIAQLANGALYVRPTIGRGPGIASDELAVLCDGLRSLRAGGHIEALDLTRAIDSLARNISARARSRHRQEFDELIGVFDAALRPLVNSIPSQLTAQARKDCLIALTKVPCLDSDATRNKVATQLIELPGITYAGIPSIEDSTTMIERVALLRPTPPWLAHFVIKSAAHSALYAHAPTLGPDLDCASLNTLVIRLRHAHRTYYRDEPNRTIELAKQLAQSIGERLDGDMMQPLLDLLDEQVIPQAWTAQQKVAALKAVLTDATPVRARRQMRDEILTRHGQKAGAAAGARGKARVERLPQIDQKSATSMCRSGLIAAALPTNAGESLVTPLLAALEGSAAIDPLGCLGLIDATLKANGCALGLGTAAALKPALVSRVINALAVGEPNELNCERVECIVALMRVCQDPSEPSLLLHAVDVLTKLPELMDAPVAVATNKRRQALLGARIAAAIANARAFMDEHYAQAAPERAEGETSSSTVSQSGQWLQPALASKVFTESRRQPESKRRN